MDVPQPCGELPGLQAAHLHQHYRKVCRYRYLLPNLTVQILLDRTLMILLTLESAKRLLSQVLREFLTFNCLIR